ADPVRGAHPQPDDEEDQEYLPQRQVKAGAARRLVAVQRIGGPVGVVRLHGGGRFLAGGGRLRGNNVGAPQCQEHCGREREQQSIHYKIPGCETWMPLSAIFRASTLGATSKAVLRSISWSSTSCFKLIVKSCMPSAAPMRMASGSLWSSASSTSLRIMAVKIMISQVGTRGTPGLIERRSFCATIPFMLKAMALRIALCISSGNKSRIRPIVEGALEA